MGHGAASGNAVHLIGERAGRTGAAANICRSCTNNRRICALSTAGAKLQYSASLGCPDNPAGLGGNHGLMVQGQQHISLYQLRLNGGGTNRQNGLTREYRGSFRHCINVAGEVEVPEIGQEALVENVLFPEEFNVFLVKMQLLDILHHLLQTGCDGKAAAIWHIPEKYVKIGDLLAEALFEIAVAHGQLIKIAEHGKIALVHGYVLSAFRAKIRFRGRILGTIIAQFALFGAVFLLFGRTWQVFSAISSDPHGLLQNPVQFAQVHFVIPASPKPSGSSLPR